MITPYSPYQLVVGVRSHSVRFAAKMDPYYESPSLWLCSEGLFVVFRESGKRVSNMPTIRVNICSAMHNVFLLPEALSLQYYESLSFWGNHRL